MQKGEKSQSKQQLSVSISKNTLIALDKYCKEKFKFKIERSPVVEKAISEFLEREGIEK